MLIMIRLSIQIARQHTLRLNWSMELCVRWVHIQKSIRITISLGTSLLMLDSTILLDFISARLERLLQVRAKLSFLYSSTIKRRRMMQM
uniref:Non-structural protein NS-S n=1 Tax=Rhizophora mucronata TaxID=61149 RepID=A0A2P2MGX0_RHIMU